MVFLLLAPYNDSMHLGQGFNSFLHVQCIDNAFEVTDDSVRTQSAGASSTDNVSQIVSYSSRFVERISDVVRSMNISAGSSIKSGSIEVNGNSLTVDEAKFSASDLSAVVSVKVVNQTTQIIDEPQFIPLNDVKMSSQRFFDIYGDCFISGFMEGGDLHGMVSMKVLNTSKKSQVESALKGGLNGAAGEFTLNEGIGSSEVNAALNQTETTITVNWSGGGQIKEEAEEWSLESLFKAAASFPGHVARCPQRTWAILTKYDNNRSFLEWADKYKIKVPSFTNCQQYTSDLLDAFMEYKNNLSRIQAVLARPELYTISQATAPVSISVETLVAERKAIKTEMRKIVAEIDRLNMDPSDLPDVEAHSTIKSPEVWATRLPILKKEAAENVFSPIKAAEVLSGFPFLEPASKATPQYPAQAAPSPDMAMKAAMAQAQQTTTAAATEIAKPSPLAAPAPAPLCPPDIEVNLTNDMKAFLASDENRDRYAAFRFDRHTGSSGGGPFNDAPAILGVMVPVQWPKRIEFHMISWESDIIVRVVNVIYDQVQLSHGTAGITHSSMSLDLAEGEYINSMKLGKGRLTWGLEGVSFVELSTSGGQSAQIGNEVGKEIVEYHPYGGCTGLKGFHGGSGDVVDRLGPIWGSV